MEQTQAGPQGTKPYAILAFARVVPASQIGLFTATMCLIIILRNQISPVTVEWKFALRDVIAIFGFLFFVNSAFCGLAAILCIALNHPTERSKAERLALRCLVALLLTLGVAFLTG